MDPFVASTASEPVGHWVCTGTDGYNQGTYGPDPVPYLCISEGKISVIRNMEGEQVVSSLKLYITGKLGVTSKDKFDFGGKTYPILGCSFYKGNGIAGYDGITVVFL